ncbi:MAG: aminotransferase [Pseudomonadota bacterium]
MNIEPFGVEIWMNEWETKCELNLAETCVESLTLGQLLSLCGESPANLATLLPMKLTYGAIEGSERLRDAIAALYLKRSAHEVLVTHGTIGANMLVHRALVERDDHVIAIVPTYQQHYSIPSSIGAEVEQLWLREEDHWLPDLERLASLCRDDTKLIALTNPNNPTGALIPREMLEEIVAIARRSGAWVLCDEVYRGTDSEGPGSTVSLSDLYERGIATAGMSKAYSLAGLRLGWISGCREVIDAALIHRDYDTISVGMLDDHFAALALEHHETLLARARTITRANLATLSDWVEGQPHLQWVRPRAGTTALLRYDLPLSSRELCLRLLRETGVMFTPGEALAMEGHLRIGYANGSEVLREGLARVSDYLARYD